MRTLLLPTLLGLLSSLTTAQYANPLIGDTGIEPDPVELAARGLITEAPEPPDPTGGHFNLLRKREFCKHPCEGAFFCVRNGAYAGCCANGFTSCLVATTCVDWTSHLGTMPTQSIRKTLRCGSTKPYCTSTYNSVFGYDFVDCGFSALKTSPQSFSTTSLRRPTVASAVPTNDSSSLSVESETGSPVGNSTEEAEKKKASDGNPEASNAERTKTLKRKRLGTGPIIGIVAGVLGVIGVAILVGICLKRRRDRDKINIPVPYSGNSPLIQEQYISPTGYPPNVYPVQHSSPQEYFPKPGEITANVYPVGPLVSMSSSPPQYLGYYVPPPPPNVVEAGGHAVPQPIR